MYEGKYPFRIWFSLSWPRVTMLTEVTLFPPRPKGSLGGSISLHALQPQRPTTGSHELSPPQASAVCLSRPCFQLRVPVKQLTPATFQPFSSHGTLNELLKFCCTPQNLFFAELTQNRYTFDSFILNSCCGVFCCHFFPLRLAIVTPRINLVGFDTAAVQSFVMFLFDNLKVERSVPLTKKSGLAYFLKSCGAPGYCGAPVENHWIKP